MRKDKTNFLAQGKGWETYSIRVSININMDTYLLYLCCIPNKKYSASAMVQFSSVPSLSRVQLFATPCMPGLPVHHHLLEFTQSHVHRVGDAIQPSHPRSSLSPTVPNPSQHQGLFQWVNSSHEVQWLMTLNLWYHCWFLSTEISEKTFLMVVLSSSLF